jgi:CRISPR system Cascade subunit CasC
LQPIERKTMSLFVEFHLIQNFAPSNLNRDDTGAPKDAFFGGHRRARVSSQCFKRAIRLATSVQGLIDPKFQGVRTQKLFRLLTERLSERGRSEAQGRIEVALNAAGLKLKEDNKTEYLLFLGDAEISGFADLIDEHWEDLATTAPSGEKKGKKEAKAGAPPEVVKKAKALLNGGKAVDVALFGRMLADLPEVNQDAACQVAHAISTHRVEREFDYFTAVDDMGDPDETGAGMIGQLEFNSATFYRYAVIDATKLLKNLKDDKDLALTAIEAFAQAMARAIPSGKQNTFAAHNPPSFVGVVLRSGGPLSLANAFEKPVSPRYDQPLTSLSVEAMATFEQELAKAYTDGGDQWCHLDLTGSWPKVRGEALASLNALSSWVRSKVAERWGA